MKASIQELMTRSGVGFGTSGARGLATEMTDRLCYAYTQGFLQYLEELGEITRGGSHSVAVGGDLRLSTDRIMAAVAGAAEDRGYAVVNCGQLPSPALALHGLENQMPAIMVTGSHIPDDRNGIKFNKVSGEVLKDDEPGIVRQVVEWREQCFDTNGGFVSRQPERPGILLPTRAYVRRYLDFFGNAALCGLRVGVYQHSSVGRDVLVEILKGVGAQVTPLGRADRFIPVDTEAIRPEDVQLAHDWAASGQYDAIVSADGDCDRPLVSNERGEWLRGDVAGILCAKFLGADSVSTPVSCNTAVEKCAWFTEVQRTRIGSPFVVKSMMEAARRGAKCVVGYEANGGFLLHSDVIREGRTLRALPTRDAVIVMLAILLMAKQARQKVSELTAALPQRFTASDRLKEFPTEQSRAILARFNCGDPAKDLDTFTRVFGSVGGVAVAVDRTDGLRFTLANREVIHLRPSGNAPEFRCYTEAASEVRAREMNGHCLQLLREMLQ